MSRKITMRDTNALYTEQRTKGMPDDGREIVMEGDNVHYEELTATRAPHFPLSNNEDEGKRLYRLLVEKNFIASNTCLDDWLYTMGYSMEQPMTVKPIVWLKNVQLAQVMLRGVFGSLIEKKELTVATMSSLAEKCFTKDGKPLRLAKFKTETSTDSDLLEDFFRP